MTIGNYVLWFSAVPTKDHRWRAIYEIKATFMSGIVIKGPVEIDETFQRAEEAMAAAHTAGSRVVQRLPR